MTKLKLNKTIVKQNDDILLDSMIIHHILEGGEIVKNLKETVNANSKLILLDRVNEEFKNMEQKEYRKTYTDENIIKKLSEVRVIEKINIDYENKEIIQAKTMYQSEKYHDVYGENLSYVDYILLQVHVTQSLLSRPASLLTEDWGIIRAAEKEGRTTFKLNYSWNIKNWYCPGCKNLCHHNNPKKNPKCQNCGTLLKKIVLDFS